MLTFRIAITAAVMAFVTALTACLIFIQIATFHAAARAAASAAMDAASANTLSRLEAEVSELNTVVRVLSSSPSLADSDDRSEVGGAVGLFKTALRRLPQADSLYVGYDNGCWLQVRRLDDLDPTERQRLGAPPGAVYNVNLVRPTSGGVLPMRRIFEAEQGNKIDQLDLWDYGYDARERIWYRDTMQADRALVSSPYASFSIGTPMITVSAPLQRQVRGVIAADLKLDKFSDLVYAQRPGEHGTAIIFDSFGVLIAHPEFARLVDYAMTHPSHPQLPEIREIQSGLVGVVMRKWDGSNRYEGTIRDEDGRDYLFRVRKFSQGDKYSGYSLLLSAVDDQNWLPGSQSGVNKSTGGGVIKFSPNGTALSPPITGFTGMGIDGVGWGTAVTKDRVWISSFNGKILVMDLNGKPVASESDFPFKEKFLGLMGIGATPSGDVWIADGSDNQLLFFPGGRIKDGRIVKVAGLKSPFDIVIDSQNRIWVANSSSDTVVRFPADDPTKVESFRAGIGVRALALDSKENVWVASNMDLKTPQPVLPDGISIMEQFKLITASMFKYVSGPPARPTGAVNMIRPDGTQPAPMGYTGEAINIPWGLNVDGNNDVWVGNMWSRSVTLLAGDNTAGHPAGTKTGDVIHVFKAGSIQMVTDASIDPAGNVWAANNWNSLEAAAGENPSRPTSTWGGGSGFTVIYGVAAPVQPPRMGKVRAN